jgi:3-deoxy-7-phosphoheptulonate synthase
MTTETMQPAQQTDWSRHSWQGKEEAQRIAYENETAVREAVAQLESFPPLVTSMEIENLRKRLTNAAEGNAFVLQGGDCAETFAETVPDKITNKLKILLQMGIVLAQGLKRPIVRVGRFAGQYAKPRSSPMEKGKLPNGDEATLMSYYGDLVNGSEFTEDQRTPDPYRMVKAFKHSAMTLNFIRSLIDGGFADLHHPEYWDLGFLDKADLTEQTDREYHAIAERIKNSLEFMEAITERSIDRVARPEFYTSHEGLNLRYEAALTREVPRKQGFYNLSCHLPWIGERTRQLDGAHVEFFRGIRNPVGVKIGPSMTGDDLVALANTLNPCGEKGKLVIICRFGAGKVADVLPPLIKAIRQSEQHPVWICDPMHANTTKTEAGIKTRRFEHIAQELQEAIEVHKQEDSILGGVHFELTGENVTECVGGAAGVSETDLDLNYETLCDPRLNYEQAMEMAFAIAERLGS